MLFLAFVFLVSSGMAQTKPVFKGQPPTNGDVDTTSRPIEKQERKITEFSDDGVFFSNKFPSARLNQVTRTGDNQYTVLITPENSPINQSPWYAFQVWSKKKKNIKVRLTYPEGSGNRYPPKISKDGKKWKPLKSKYIVEEEKGMGATLSTQIPKRILMTLKVGKKPLWVAAQEIEDTKRIYAWMDKLSRKRHVASREIGKSKDGRSIRVMRVGDSDSKRMVMVISRQHPPEVTGYLAMKAFVEKLADNSRLSKKFRKQYSVYIVPVVNPDGVDEGNWRHNSGGVDLNRDWTKFNQPEGAVVSNLIKEREAATGGKFYFGIDFHSTWDDIYYPMPEGLESNMTGLVFDWIAAIENAIPGYKPNVRPTQRLKPAIISRNYFYFSHGMDAIVFEIGDNTARKFIEKKGKVGATELMKLMLARTPARGGEIESNK